MDPWPTRIETITLFVDDLTAAKRFYRDVFGLPFKYEDDDSAVFDVATVQVNLLRIAAAPELIEPATVGSAEAGARFLLTIPVADVDQTAGELVRRGAELLNGPIDRPWGVRTAAFRDPAGHVWELAS